MRNLKKILALVLALAMSLSLVTIASGADFNDADEIELTEAVDVMTTIGVLEGHNTGDFAPQGTLTREQAAKIITYMLLGENADRLSVGSTSFSDVSADRWSAADIEYCTTLGIIAGYGDGTFNPRGNLTGYAFAKMLLTALGYKADAEGLTGTGWTINVSRLALQVGLDDGIEDIVWGSSITREQAAQMALNAIKTPLVQYDDGVTVIVNGTPVTVGSGKAYYVTTTLAKEQRISKQTLTNSKEFTVEFGERYFPGLVLDSDVVDAFGRPSYTWSYNTEDIGTYIDSDLLKAEYTTAIEGRDAYSDVGSFAAKEYTLYVYVDGDKCSHIALSDLDRENDDNLSHTGNGALTQIFLDDEKGEITIAIINTYLAETDIYSESKETLSLNDVYGYEGEHAYNVADIKLEDMASIADYDEETMVLVTIAEGVVQSMEAPEVLSEVTLNAFSKGESVTTGGAKYDYAATAAYADGVLNNYDNSNLGDTTYNIYLDQYGYLIGIEIVTEKNEYVFITGYDYTASNRVDSTATATAIFAATGEMTSIQVDVEDSVYENTSADWRTESDAAARMENTWYTYTVDKNNVYTLKYVERQLSEYVPDGKVIDKAHIAMKHTNVTPGVDRWAYGNDATNYITVGTRALRGDGVIGQVNSFVTGTKNANISVYNETDVRADLTLYGASDVSYGAYAVYNGNNYIVAAVVVGEDTAASDNYAYLYGEPEEESYDGDDYFWKMHAVLNGEDTIVTFRSELPRDDDFDAGLYRLYYDANDYVIDVDAYAGSSFADYNANPMQINVIAYDADGVVATGSDLSVENNTLWATTETSQQGVALADDCKAVVIERSADNSLKTVEYSSVRTAIRNLDNEGQDFTGELYAFIDDGMASSVLFVDNISEVTGPVSKDITFIFTDAGNNFAQPIYTVADGSKVTPTDADIQNMLERAGCTNISRAAGRWNFTYRGMAYYFETIAPKQLWTVKVDDKLVAYKDTTGLYDKDTFAAGETIDFTTYSNGTGAIFNSSDKTTYVNAYRAYTALGDEWTNKKDCGNIDFKTGYVQPTFTLTAFGATSYWDIYYTYEGVRNSTTQPTALKAGDTLTITAELKSDFSWGYVGTFTATGASKVTCNNNSVIDDIATDSIDLKNMQIPAGTQLSFTYTVATNSNPTYTVLFSH